MIRGVRRHLGVANQLRGRGQQEQKKPVYENNPFLPSKITAPTRLTKIMRRELSQLDNELDSVKMEIAKMQNVQISNMMNREIRRHAQNIKDESTEYSNKELKLTEVVLDFKYFYFWTYQGYFFGLVESANQIKENCSKYSLTVENDLNGPKEHLEYRINKTRYSQKMVSAKWNHENEGFNFVKYFENMLIQVSSIWIAEKSGSIFVHFCPTFRISLVLQLSFESSKICEIENQSESVLPSYLNQKKDIFLIKVPFQNTYLRLYANIKSENIGADTNIWHQNPLTREIADSVHSL